jgi:hypothetical protein
VQSQGYVNCCCVLLANAAAACVDWGGHAFSFTVCSAVLSVPVLWLRLFSSACVLAAFWLISGLWPRLPYLLMLMLAFCALVRCDVLPGHKWGPRKCCRHARQCPASTKVHPGRKQMSHAAGKCVATVQGNAAHRLQDTAWTS